MTDSPRLARPDEFPDLNGGRYRSARLARLRRKYGRILGVERNRTAVPLTDPLDDLFTSPATGYPAEEQ